MTSVSPLHAILKRNKSRFNPSRDQDFLPAALAVLEKPPSPASLMLALTLSCLVIAALIWSIVSFTDIVAVAPGKIQPSGRVKTIQPVEGGRVGEIAVNNGDRVKKGDLLIKIDEQDALAEYDFLKVSYIDALAEAQRHYASVAAARDAALTSIAWNDDIPDDVRLRQERVFQSDISMLKSQISSIETQRQQKLAERDRLESLISAQRSLIEVVTERVTMRNSLVDTGAGSKANLIDAKETLGRLVADLANAVGQMQESLRGIDALEAEKNKTTSTFIADHMTKYSLARRDVDSFVPKLTKAKARLENMKILSPIDGIVSASAITTIGQVVSPGQEIMRIVPDGLELEAEAYLLNKDVGFIHSGQEVMIKVDAFPFTRYGLIKAEVVRISTDAVAQPELMQGENDPAHPLDTKNVAGTQRVQNLVYPATIKLRQTSILVDGVEVPLSPGMSIVAEIKTGRRRLIDFILSPIREVTSDSMRER